ncbi:uncharacterized protein UDID_11488 [Ustilago sp. UG-2017a]|nr:uncharacterized protein UDID_11488 [Ustilago sp. UG-2017a]
MAANQGQIRVHRPTTKGTLTIMIGCPTPLIPALHSLLRAMGDRLFHMGEEAGKGNSMKAVNQILCGVHVAAAAEALALASKMGIDKAKALEVVSGSAASSWMLRDRGPRMSEEEPKANSMMQILVKDLGIVADVAREVGAATPLTAAAQQMFVAGVGSGLKFKDDSEVIRVYEAMNGDASRNG